MMELLAPAGNLEKLKTALLFGADAVYCGAGSYSLRAPETSFSLADLAEGVIYAHARNRRVYLAMNIFAFDDDLAEMMDYLREAVQLGVDAVIISDPGLLSLIRKSGLDLNIHLSTQANTTNSESVLFWQNQGVSRIVLARELSLTRASGIKANVPGMELEAFGHGAMCIAYSGRCLLSKFLGNRSANRGNCSQPCRWQYEMQEARCGEELAIQEDRRGTYILNSRDLCMIEHIPALAAAGVDSLKIEGRMKTAYYVAAVIRVYRKALDSFKMSGNQYSLDPEWLEELRKVSHRPYTTGFYLPGLGDETEYNSDASYIREYDFVGVVDEHNYYGNSLKIRARNRFSVGDTLEIIDPVSPEVVKVRVERISDQEGKTLEQAHNSYVVNIPLDKIKDIKISQGAIARRKCE